MLTSMFHFKYCALFMSCVRAALPPGAIAAAIADAVAFGWAAACICVPLGGKSAGIGAVVCPSAARKALAASCVIGISVGCICPFWSLTIISFRSAEMESN